MQPTLNCRRLQRPILFSRTRRKSVYRSRNFKTRFGGLRYFSPCFRSYSCDFCRQAFSNSFVKCQCSLDLWSWSKHSSKLLPHAFQIDKISLNLDSRLIISFVRNRNQSVFIGLFYTYALLACFLIQSIFFQQYLDRTFSMGGRMRTALMNCIYKKVNIAS